MKYTVTIKDNESGEIIHDVECNAIIAGISLGDCVAVSVGISSCNVRELLSAYKAAETARQELEKKHPILLFADILSEVKEKEDIDND